MTTINAWYEDEQLNIVEEVETAQGKVQVRGSKLIIRFVPKDDPFNQSGKAYFTVGVKMTASKRVFERTENGFTVKETPELFGEYYCLTLDSSMQDMKDAVDCCIKACIEGIKKQYGQPTEA